MAFWRWSTMDTHNPFTLRFWHWGNLFGTSQGENIQQRKQAAITNLYNRIRLSNPNHPDANVRCPLTEKVIEHPAITNQGIVYEKYALLSRLSISNRIPGSLYPISPKDVYDFKELNGVLAYAHQRQTHYLASYKKHLSDASSALNRELSHQYASIFVCPLSNRLMKNCVITPHGRIYDKDAILAYLEQTGTRGVDPIDGLPLSKSCLVDFSDFNQYLMLYRNKFAELLEEAYAKSTHFADVVGTGLSFFASLLTVPPPTPAAVASLAQPRQITP